MYRSMRGWTTAFATTSAKMNNQQRRERTI
jgi:hypothetical protein